MRISDAYRAIFRKLSSRCLNGVFLSKQVCTRNIAWPAGVGRGSVTESRLCLSKLWLSPPQWPWLLLPYRLAAMVIQVTPATGTTGGMIGESIVARSENDSVSSLIPLRQWSDSQPSSSHYEPRLKAQAV